MGFHLLFLWPKVKSPTKGVSYQTKSKPKAAFVQFIFKNYPHATGYEYRFVLFHLTVPPSAFLLPSSLPHPLLRWPMEVTASAPGQAQGATPAAGLGTHGSSAATTSSVASLGHGSGSSRVQLHGGPVLVALPASALSRLGHGEVHQSRRGYGVGELLRA